MIDTGGCPLWAELLATAQRAARSPAWWWCHPGDRGTCAERLVALGYAERRDTPRGPLYRASPLALAVDEAVTGR